MPKVISKLEKNCKLYADESSYLLISCSSSLCKFIVLQKDVMTTSSLSNMTNQSVCCVTAAPITAVDS